MKNRLQIALEEVGRSVSCRLEEKGLYISAYVKDFFVNCGVWVSYICPSGITMGKNKEIMLIHYL